MVPVALASILDESSLKGSSHAIHAVSHSLELYKPLGAILGIDKNLASGIPSIGAESIAPVGQFDFSKTKWVDNDFADSSSKGWIQNFDVALYKDGGKPGEFRPRTALYGDGFPFDKAMVNEHVFLLRSILLGQPYLYYLFNFDLVLAQSFTRVRRKERNQVSIKKKCDRVPSSNQTRD
jgi:hypothetical protein